MNININHYKLQTNLLGPYIRSVLWVQGCKKNCKNCIAPSTHGMDERLMISSDILASLFSMQKNTEGITISGGEPFLQCEALFELVTEIRKIRPDYGVIVYTGMKYTELITSGNDTVKQFISVIDLLIDGEYKSELSDERFAVGSANQNIIKISDRYSDEVIDNFYYNNVNPEKIEICIDNNNVSFTGVPSEKSANVWETVKNNLRNLK